MNIVELNKRLVEVKQLVRRFKRDQDLREIVQEKREFAIDLDELTSSSGEESAGEASKKLSRSGTFMIKKSENTFDIRDSVDISQEMNPFTPQKLPKEEKFATRHKVKPARAFSQEMGIINYK